MTYTEFKEYNDRNESKITDELKRIKILRYNRCTDEVQVEDGEKYQAKIAVEDIIWAVQNQFLYVLNAEQAINVIS